MAKKIAVLLKDKQSEGLRVSGGITILDDEIHVFVLDRKLEDTEQVAANRELVAELELPVYTNTKDNPEFTYLSNAELAKKLLEFDNVMTF